MKISFSKTTDLVILHPVDKTPLVGAGDKPLTLKIFGSMSKEFRRVRNAQLNDALAKKSEDEKPTFEEVEQRACELLAGSIADIGNLSELETDDHKGMTEDNAVQFLIDTPWLRDQIDAAVANQALFIVGGSKKPKKL